jgi:hypothetical protein
MEVSRAGGWIAQTAADRSRIPKIQGAQECTLSAEADLAITTHRQAWSRPPIQVDFSGELLRSLHV